MRLVLLLLSNPFKTLKFTYTWLTQSLLVVLRRILLPHIPSYQPLRLQLQRAYLSSATCTFPDLTHRLPVGLVPESRAKHVTGHGFEAYLIPGAKLHLLERSTHRPRQRCIAVYAHGGGYARGEAKMYLNYMERWVRVAEETAGLDLAFFSVEYPLSTKDPHPAQRISFIAAYKFLLKQGVPPCEILFMGDSAGGGLSILSGIECCNQKLPQPAGTILISPWMGTMHAFEGGNALVETDYVVHANQSTPALVSLWLKGDAANSRDANPLYNLPEDIKALSPQLILVGAGEFALQESKDWASLCAEAGVKHRLVCEWGQLHIYALGSRWLEPSVRQKTDKIIMEWMEMCLRDSQ